MMIGGFLVASIHARAASRYRAMASIMHVSDLQGLLFDLAPVTCLYKAFVSSDAS